LKLSVKEIVKSGVSVITTLGAKGVKIDFATDSNEIQSLVVKSVKIKKMVDPTGAGDAWRGGFVGALMDGKPLKECLVMGNVMASFAVETMGTVEYKADKKEVERRVKSLIG
jgi:adenosine kinase